MSRNQAVRQFFRGSPVEEVRLSEASSQADRVEGQCEGCPLNRVKIGIAVRVKKICASPDIQVRLREIGFYEQQIIRLLAAQFNCICQVCNARLAISQNPARLILVEPLEIARDSLQGDSPKHVGGSIALNPSVH